MNELCSENFHNYSSEVNSCPDLNNPPYDVNALVGKPPYYKPPAPRYADVPRKPFQPAANIQDVVCYNCHQLGHYSSSCLYPKQKPVDEKASASLCPNCASKSGNVKQEGHLNMTPPLPLISETTHPPIEQRTTNLKDPHK